jgi:hypothetical protein
MMIRKRQTVVVSKLVSDHTTETTVGTNRDSFRRRPVDIYSEMSLAEASDVESLPAFAITLEESSGDTTPSRGSNQQADAGKIVIAGR